MADRERLIELIQDIVVPHFAVQIADHLLANGVIIKPVGQIEELNLGVRAYNALKRAGINTVEELLGWDEERLLTIRGMGIVVADEVLGKLAEWEVKHRRQLPDQPEMDGGSEDG